MSAWETIESAPEKGSFLVYGGRWVSASKDGEASQPSEVAHVNRAYGYRKFHVANADEFWPHIEDPTHWMPLPEPPK